MTVKKKDNSFLQLWITISLSSSHSSLIFPLIFSSQPSPKNISNKIKLVCNTNKHKIIIIMWQICSWWPIWKRCLMEECTSLQLPHAHFRLAFWNLCFDNSNGTKGRSPQVRWWKRCLMEGCTTVFRLSFGPMPISVWHFETYFSSTQTGTKGRSPQVRWDGSVCLTAINNTPPEA